MWLILLQLLASVGHGLFDVKPHYLPLSHFSDNLQRWLNLEYHPLHTKWQDIEANAESDLRLAPAEMS